MVSLQFADALSTRADSEAAFSEAVAQLRAALGAGEIDLCTVFVSHHHGDLLEQLGSRLARELDAGCVLGCTGESIVGGTREVEGSPALALWGARLPRTRLKPFVLRVEKSEEALIFQGFPQVEEPERTSLLLLADPFTFPMQPLLEHLNDNLPGLLAVGGMASGGMGPGQNLLFLDAEVLAEGAVGLLLEGEIEIRPVVSQGCRPVGKPWVITGMRGPAILELGGKRAAEALVETLRELPEADRRLLQRQPFLGLAVDPTKSSFARGDLLVRGILGLDARQGAIVVSDASIRRGMSVQFLVRDADSAGEDLRQLLALEAAAAPGGDPRSIGALLFSCNGRGSRMFSVPDHDVGHLHEALGARVPTAGFFAMGEIGPVGGRNFLHGFTASVALFRERA